MWIAKNSVTGRTYGKPFKSIYECTSFIDNKLKLLEYEFQRAFALEEKFLEDIEVCLKSKGDIFGDMQLRFQLGFDNLFNNSFDVDLMKLEIQKAFADKKTSRKIDKQIDIYVRTNWCKNNIIRCWNIEQNRFATGFDF